MENLIEWLKYWNVKGDEYFIVDEELDGHLNMYKEWVLTNKCIFPQNPEGLKELNLLLKALKEGRVIIK